MDFSKNYKNFFNSHLLALLIIIAGALFVRLYGLGDYYLSNDEAWHLVVADQKNLWEVIQYNFINEAHPPLSPIIWHLMLKISHNHLWLRMASLICGILLIPSIYLFGRLYIGRAAGVAMALIIAFAPISIALSTSIRAYSMMMLALTWAAIFVFNYKTNLRHSLVCYFICSLAAIELNHSSAFMILAFGLLLTSHAWQRKKDFVIIFIMHIFLASAVIGYSYALKNYYGFSGNFTYFSPTTGLVESLIYYLSIIERSYTWFLSDLKIGKSFVENLGLFSILTIIFTLFILIKSQKFELLSLALTPVLALSLADYFNYYPFTSNARNNLLLFLSNLTILGFFVQITSGYLAKLYKNEKYLAKLSVYSLIKNKNFSLSFLLTRLCRKALTALFLDEKNILKILPTLKISALLVTIFFISVFFQKKNFFRNTISVCEEFLLTKNDYNLLTQELAKNNNPQNIFITINTNIWNLLFMSKEDGSVKVITKNLARFQNQNLQVYFTSFPERQKPSIHNISDYNLFFNDLFDYLKSTGQFENLESITFFEAGLANDYLSYLFRSQLGKKTNDELQLSYGYNFYFKNYEHACRKEVLLFSLTPEFIENKILNESAQ